MRLHPENIYLVGSVDALKDWLPDYALSLSPANYPIWSGMPHKSLVYVRFADLTRMNSQRDPPRGVRNPIQVHPQVPW